MGSSGTSLSNGAIQLSGRTIPSHFVLSSSSCSPATTVVHWAVALHVAPSAALPCCRSSRHFKFPYLTTLPNYCIYSTLDTIPAHNSDELGVIFTVSPPKSAQRQPAGTDAEVSTPSEPQFILQQHKLGISVHSVHSLINEAREAFPAARRDYLHARREDISGGHTEGKRGEEEAVAAETLLCVTRALLLINADHGSAWNSRKELVSDGVYGNIRGEIKARSAVVVSVLSPNAWPPGVLAWQRLEVCNARRTP